MRCLVGSIALLFTLSPMALGAAANGLPRDEARDGWIELFDGQTITGWSIEGDYEIVDGTLILGGPNPTSATLHIHSGGDFQVS